MSNNEIVIESLKVYLSHCSNQVTRKRNISGKPQTTKQLQRVIRIQEDYRGKFDAAYDLLVKIDKGEVSL